MASSPGLPMGYSSHMSKGQQNVQLLAGIVAMQGIIID
jgi:hypothetical protein